MTTTTEDQVTEQIRPKFPVDTSHIQLVDATTEKIIANWQPPYVPRRALQPKRHWLYTALIETAAALIFLVTTVGAGIFYYPLLADWLGDWALLTCAICAVTYGIITVASVKILKDW